MSVGKGTAELQAQKRRWWEHWPAEAGMRIPEKNPARCGFGFVCDGVGAGRAALSKHRLSTRHLFGALKCREGSPGLCSLPMTDLAGHPLGISRGCWLFTSPLCLAHLPQMAGT